MAEYQSIKSDVLHKLESNLPEIRARFGIETLGIFGSVSRGEDTPDSDIDILYRFKEGRGRMREFIALADYLEALFNRKIDMISADFVNPYMKPYIEDDVILYGTNKMIA